MAKDATRQWVKVAEALPSDWRHDREVLEWIRDRRVGPLCALLEADKKEEKENLKELRRRYPQECDRARREERGEYEWDDQDDEDIGDLTDRQWDRGNANRNAR